MATLFLLCGLPGSGKTALARRLEAEQPALRLTPDEWMSALSIDGLDEARREAVEALQWELASAALRLGVDVVLDWGFWTRRHRDEFRARAAALGVRAVVRHLDVPRVELSRRLVLRNAALPPHTFRVEEDQLASWAREFEPPTPDELG